MKTKPKVSKKAGRSKRKVKAEPARSKRTKSKKDLFQPDIDAVLDSVERRFKLSANMADRFVYAISSGCLVLDLILGGGLIGGAGYTIAGAESSGKSTTVMNLLASRIKYALDDPCPILYFDAEGSMDPRYFESMLRNTKLKSRDIFGVKKADGKGWTVKPLIRYYAESRGEQTLDAINSFLKRLPDMELMDGQWYYAYENTKENRATVGQHYSKELFSTYNKFYVKTSKDTPQAILVIDSWVSLIPEKMDDEDKGAGLGALARFFSEYLPKLKSKLRRKNVIVFGANQLRERPMAQGDPRYEPGGNALKHLSDARIWSTTRSVPHGTGPIEEEKSIDGKGTDTYQYKHLQARKNKLATPFLTGWMRIHVKDWKGKNRGIDPVWDVYQYLKMTGQVGGNRKKLKVKMLSGPEFNADWLVFKALIGGTLPIRQEAAKACKIKGKTPNLYKLCLAQLKSGVGTKLYYENLANGTDEDGEE